MNTIFILNKPENHFGFRIWEIIQKKVKTMTDICYTTGNK